MVKTFKVALIVLFFVGSLFLVNMLMNEQTKRLDVYYEVEALREDNADLLDKLNRLEQEIDIFIERIGELEQEVGNFKSDYEMSFEED